jgi:hypothetical protein
MERLLKTTKLLTDIQNTAKSILLRSAEVIKDLYDEGEIIEDVIDKSGTDADDETIAAEICVIVENLANDSKIVDKELPEFVEAFQQGEKFIENIDSQFFLEVWFGDMYEKQGIEALEELRSELKQQLKSLNNKELTETLVSKFKNSTSSEASQSSSSMWDFLGF